MRLVISLLLLGFFYHLISKESFILVDLNKNKIVTEFGLIDERVTPACSFNIALSLMAYDSKILENQNLPIWNIEGDNQVFHDGKKVQTPPNWMKNSCIWFSQLISQKLGSQKIHQYLDLFEYGNKDFSGKNNKQNCPWINSSLKISPKEQVQLVQKIMQNKLPISKNAIEMTKKILFKEEFNGWKLH